MEKRRLPSIITKTLNLLTWMIPVLERMPKTTPFMAMANRVVECTLDGLTCGLKALHEQNLEYRKQLIEASAVTTHPTPCAAAPCPACNTSGRSATYRASFTKSKSEKIIN